MIKRHFVLVALLFLSVSGAYGQLRLGLTLPRRSYLLGESIVATLALESQNPVPLVFGQDHHNAVLQIDISRSGVGVRAPSPGRKPIERDIVVLSGNSYRDVVEITSLYNYLGPGTYRASAVVSYGGRTFFSSPFVFDVVRGIAMESVRYMLPGYSDIELEYSVRYATRNNREEAYLMIETTDGRSLYGTFALGPLLRIYKPLIRMQSDGSIVVVHQSGRNRYTRSTFVVDRAGAEFVEQRHFGSDGTPFPE